MRLATLMCGVFLVLLMAACGSPEEFARRSGGPSDAGKTNDAGRPDEDSGAPEDDAGAIPAKDGGSDASPVHPKFFAGFANIHCTTNYQVHMGIGSLVVTQIWDDMRTLATVNWNVDGPSGKTWELHFLRRQILGYFAQAPIAIPSKTHSVTFEFADALPDGTGGYVIHSISATDPALDLKCSVTLLCGAVSQPCE